jgi:hypothetical protein
MNALLVTNSKLTKSFAGLFASGLKPPVRPLSAISHPDIRLKYCVYGHSVATQLNPRGVTTAARHATVVVAVPSTVHYPPNYKIKIY